jgi:hypothetical protein
MDISNFTESLLRVIMETVINASTDVIEPVHSSDHVYEFDNVTDFWKKRDFREGDYVKIDGTLSVFGPTMFGSPRSKRDLHRETRRFVLNAIESDPDYITQFDSLISYTAGQMVVRCNFPDLPYTYLGFYHSIARNSIPLFVNTEYYLREIAKFFEDGVTAVEVSILGRFNHTDTNFLRSFLEAFKLDEIYDGELLEERLSQQDYSIQVNGDTPIGGKIDSTHIDMKGPSRYLDGDIWVVAKNSNNIGIVSRFIDLTDSEDLQIERLLLKQDVRSIFKASEIISEYDQVNRIFEEANQILDSDRLLRAFLSKKNIQIERFEHDSEVGSVRKRLVLVQLLSRLPSAQFDQLIFALNPPLSNVPPTSAPQSQRVIALLEWADNPIGCGLGTLDETYQLIVRASQ